MSNQPPPQFGGHPSYAQQWPLPFPSMIPSNFASNSESQAAGPPPLLDTSQAFEYSLGSTNANSRLLAQGNSGDPSIFLPPQFPFMGQIDLSQFVPPFPQMPLPPFGFPPMPAPPGSSTIRPVSMKSQGAVATNPSSSQSRVRDVQSSSSSNREEGEVSEGEIGQHVNGTKTKASRASAALPASFEEGETFSSQSSASTRSSSPYNPPLSVSADAEVVNRAIELQKQNATTPKLDSSPPSKSAAQLRVQAQGALLSLAPHNIRYNELVAEGINPAVLKQLYEEVGIRVATPRPVNPATVAPAEKIAKPELPVQVHRPKETTQPDKNKIPQLPAASATPSDSGKPLERKELIAQMLAAKAAKASQPTTPKEVSEGSQPPAAAPSPSTTPSSEKTKENGAPLKEKNKAQTELARQRIEALKKQALLKSQQKAQLLSQASQEEKPLMSTGPSLPAVHHPLPVRPPAPHPSESAGIPGLSLTELNPEVESQSSSGGSSGIAVDSTPLARANQRKRPRASDFDDAGAISKKHYQVPAPYMSRDSDKLIIHISDDESLYGDDEGEDMDVDSSPDQDSALATISTPLEVPRLQLQKSVPGTRASTSTPQAPTRPSDQEQMRQKNLEIQALHRKIAEMEERRKAKLAASRTQSPRILEDSAPASADLVGTPPAPPATDVREAKEPNTTPRVALGVRLNVIDSFSPSSIRILASMKSAQLNSLRCKILRIGEIEQGLSDLDAETAFSDSDLVSCKEEADRFLCGITDEKEARMQLIDELKNLSYDLNGLTMADMDELCRQAASRQQHLAAREATTQSVADSEDIVIPDADAPVAAKEEVAAVLASHSSESDFYADEPTNVDTVKGLNEAPAPAQPDATCSVLDESEDHSSSDDSSSSDSDSGGSGSDDSVSVSGESRSHEDSASEEEVEASDAEAIVDTAQTVDDDQMQIDITDHPVPDRPPVHAIEKEAGDVEDDAHDIDEEEPESESESESKGEAKAKAEAEAEDGPEDEEDEEDEYEPTDHNDQEGDLSDAESSAESEAYEPPEPETGAESPRSTYSPPPPASLEDTADLQPLLDASQIDKPLTETPRVTSLEARPVYQGSDADILGVKSSPKTSVPNFSPYVSPLRHFKAYRYHPRYTEEVSDGYRSLTYSHDIDPMKHLCPFELAGGVCNDRSCEFQHFRDMSLSDDKILIQMGSVREGQTEEEKETYLAGLKEIINEMRRDKVKDFSTVASEIAAYRRRFLQDPSRVLPL
ncbi:hypothetical protein PMG11_08787 [Penicillium brasilianum]|uniref:Putative zinc-finger domain-containing protein n=1 Tax=Penicillium brasilianum TaxID=104259 RepID=A0A0F7TTU2_PENBI|nr:hypothetical protein PMG11_08787 [Penicillium brasilianum]